MWALAHLPFDHRCSSLFSLSSRSLARHEIEKKEETNSKHRFHHFLSHFASEKHMLRYCLLALMLVQDAASLLVQPHAAVTTPLLRRTGVSPSMQFGGKPEREGLTRANEPEEFFSTNMDDMTDAEKIKSPVVIGGLLILIAPFLVGAIALQVYR
jgi:hypothetical protein